jgi:hypothetical protein
LTTPENQFNPELVRVFAMMVAGILLNLGLFFVLALFAPLVVGIILGYILGHKWNGMITSFLGAVVAYLVIFVVTGFGTDLAVLTTAVILMALIGGLGGFLGAIMYHRMNSTRPQVSTTIRPGE